MKKNISFMIVPHKKCHVNPENVYKKCFPVWLTPKATTKTTINMSVRCKCKGYKHVNTQCTPYQ